MRIIAFDTETCLIAYPNQVNPDMVSIAFADVEGASLSLATSDSARLTLRGALEDDNTIIVGQNVSFDLHVCLKQWPDLWASVWKALKAGRIKDTMLREKLYLLSTEGNVLAKPSSLKALTERYLGIEIEGKEDGWRFRYVELKDTPIQEWPPEASEYALNDAIYTLQVYTHQEQIRAARGPGSMNSEALQVAAAFALRGMEIQGMRIDPEMVKVLHSQYDAAHEGAKEALKEYGIIRENGSRDQKALEAMLEELGVTERTKSGRVATDKKTMAKLVSDDPRLEAYREYSDTLKAVTTFIPQMEFPRVHPRFNPIVNTLRTSCRSSNYYKHHGQQYGKNVIRRGDPTPSINLQQIPRGSNFRRAFIPEEGHVFICADYCNLELVSAAQTYYSLLGFSKLREVLNEGTNLHDVTGTIIYNDHTGSDIEIQEFRTLIRTGDPTAKFCRQSAKFVNLGCPGGQSADTIFRLANDLGIAITLDQADRWREAARGRFPEYDMFFGSVLPQMARGHMGITVDGEYKRVQRYDIDVMGIYRAKCTYTSGANGLTMQMPSALGKKRAMVRLYERCTNPDSNSALSQCTLILDMHDEFLLNAPEHLAEQAQREMAECMIDGMQSVFKDMRVGVESMIQRRWDKSADAEHGDKEFFKNPGEGLTEKCEV